MQMVFPLFDTRPTLFGCKVGDSTAAQILDV
jgi:hypothetical protein